ncbi:MAG: fatty acid desaturase, partial [Myxococcota bacterium]
AAGVQRPMQTSLDLKSATAPSPLPLLTDPRAPSAPTWFHRVADAVALRWLNDPRDVILTRPLAEVFVFVLPFTIALFLVPTWALVVMGPLYLAHVFANYAGRIVLGLHAVTHRPLFRRKVRWADRIWTHVMPVFVGMPPFAYYAHHRMMHHRENVSESDLSGTAEYRRDSPLHFVHYWIRFAIFGYFHLTSWLMRRGHRGVAVRILAWSALFYGVVGIGLWFAFWPTLISFVIPYLLLRFFLMAGNWSEHAFVDVQDPTNNYRNSTCLMNTGYNHRAYNAGYHLVHHIVPGLHWAEHPAYVEDHLSDFADNDAILFDGVSSNQQIWWMLMTGNYEFLASKLVDVGSRRPELADKVAFLQSRVRGQRGVRKGMLERREAAVGVPAGPGIG